jgi:hypothetical protein
MTKSDTIDLPKFIPPSSVRDVFASAERMRSEMVARIAIPVRGKNKPLGLEEVETGEGEDG